MLGVICGALNVADAAFRTCMTEFLHSLERCGAGAARQGSAVPRARGSQRLRVLLPAAHVAPASVETPVVLSLAHPCYKSFADPEAAPVAPQQPGWETGGVRCDSQLLLLSHRFI